MRVEIEGVDQLKAVLKRYDGNAVPAVSAAIYREANDIMRESKHQAPVDLGALRASGTVEMPEATPSGVSVAFGYGGAASRYALIQHERLDYRHAVGNAKYLEAPTLQAANGMGARLAGTIRRMLGL